MLSNKFLLFKILIKSLLLLSTTAYASGSYRSTVALDFENILRQEFAKFAVQRANIEKELWSHLISDFPEHSSFIERHIGHFTQLPAKIHQEGLSNAEFAEKFGSTDENLGFLDLLVEIKKTKTKAEIHELVVKKDIFKQYLSDLKAANNAYDDILKNKWREIYAKVPSSEKSEFEEVNKSFLEDHWPIALGNIVKFFELKAWYVAMAVDVA